jgi:acyl-CoA thioesterase
MWREDAASRELNMELREVRLGYARLSMTITRSMCNGQKVCHGGLIFMLADTAFGYACNSHNQRSVSASCSIDFIAPAFIDDRLSAEASEVDRRERRGIYDVKVMNQKGETVALFRGHSATVKGTWV